MSRPCSHRWFLCLLLAAFAVGVVNGTPLWAQAPAPAEAPAVPPEQTTPRAVLQAFLDRMERNDKPAAARLLDLSGLPAEAVSAKGPELAYLLYEVMQRVVELPDTLGDDRGKLQTSFDSVPGDPDHPEPWSLAELDPSAAPEAKQIKIVQAGDGRWVFSSETVAQIEELFEQTEDKPPVQQPLATEAKPTEPFSVWYRNRFPEALRHKHLLLPTYQWLSLLVIAAVGVAADRVSRWLLTQLADFLLHRYDPDFTDSTSPVWRPVGRLAHAATWYGAAFAIGLPLRFVGLLLVVLKIVTIIAAIGAAFAVIRLVSGYLTRRARRSPEKFDDLVIPVATTSARVLVVVVGVLLATAAFNDQLPATLLGGLGIGGIAIALASQETLSNFFGSITVLFDRPFGVGDWVLVDGIEGEVETVGFRSTRIRTGMNSQVTLPNSRLAGAAVDNWGRRKYRRYLTRLGVEYDTTPDQIDAFCEGIRELIRRQPHTRKDFYAAYFNEFGGSALEILLVVFFEAPDWPTELRERHRLLADILRLAEKLEIGFAFPTQTVHLHQSEAPSRKTPLPDPEHAGQVSAARIAGELPNYQDRPGKVKFTGPTPLDEFAIDDQPPAESHATRRG